MKLALPQGQNRKGFYLLANQLHVAEVASLVRGHHQDTTLARLKLHRHFQLPRRQSLTSVSEEL